MVMMTKKKQRIDFFYKTIVLFTVGCFLGCVFETVLCFFQRGYFESRKGLIYGPFNAVYGLGITAVVLVLENYKKNSSLFLAGALTGGGIEYFCSWIQERLFGTISWDYSHYFLNFDGRTSLYHMIWWGILALLFMRVLYPKVINFIQKGNENKRFVIALLLTIFFAFDLSISGYANYRQAERVKGIQATTSLQSFFDRHYPDSFLNRIYPNRTDAKTKIKINQKKK